MKGELNKRLMCECRCNERLKDRVERSTRLGYSVLVINKDVDNYFVYYKSINRELKTRPTHEIVLYT
jgi:hypothetical protein